MRPTVLEKINPFIKVVTILVCGILMALTSSWKLNLAVLIAAGIAAVVQLQIVLACQDVCAGYSIGWRHICLRHVLWQECGTVGVYL